MSRYKIAELAVEIQPDGSLRYWCYNAGMHPSQGGMEFTYGNFGTPNLEQSLDILKSKLMRDESLILDEIKRKEEKKDD